jgi:glutamine---fructose-6-phosphate transaminase (isomerizing)
MCGIVGYIGRRDPRSVLLEGLAKLEYRGYDSAGIAVHDGEGVHCHRAVGNLQELRRTVEREWECRGAVVTANAVSTVGIAHTRWATHGGVTAENAHPHTDCGGRIHIVLNGIVENHRELRAGLEAAGCRFTSETDAEPIAHLVEHQLNLGLDLRDAVRRASAELVGHYAIVVLDRDCPSQLIAVRRECPLVLGLGDGEAFVASSPSAFRAFTARAAVVPDGALASLDCDGVRLIEASSGTPCLLVEERITWQPADAEKGDFSTFTRKEIYEQPAMVAQTLRHALDAGQPTDPARTLARAGRIVIVACGTSYHAGLLGSHFLRAWAGMPATAEIASEWRYSEPMLDPADIVLGISQSGETRDTLAALQLARDRGAATAAITNVEGSQICREAGTVLLTRAGPEIGVAATKTFSTQAVLLASLAMQLAELRGTIPREQAAALRGDLQALPSLLAETIQRSLFAAEGFARRWADSPFFFYIGRNVGLPIALEGALKMKEISYVPSDAYAAGEMKHGPIALLSAQTPTIAVAVGTPVPEKLVSNISEITARGSRVLAIASDSDMGILEHVEAAVFVPRTDWRLQAILASVPLQLLALHVAERRGLNVDQPRNLAKTVTVE